MCFQIFIIFSMSGFDLFGLDFPLANPISSLDKLSSSDVTKICLFSPSHLFLRLAARTLIRYRYFPSVVMVNHHNDQQLYFQSPTRSIGLGNLRSWRWTLLLALHSISSASLRVQFKKLTVWWPILFKKIPHVRCWLPSWCAWRELAGTTTWVYWLGSIAVVLVSKSPLTGPVESKWGVWWL